MKTLWHHSRQKKSDRPVDSMELHRLVSLGLIEPTDLIRRSGSKRWVEASRVVGLFNSHEPQWYVSRDEGFYGPVTMDGLLSLARGGQLQPDDLVWKSGMGRCKRAGRINGLFPVAVPATSHSVSMPARPLAHSSALRLAWRRIVTIIPEGSLAGAEPIDTAGNSVPNVGSSVERGLMRKSRRDRSEVSGQADSRRTRWASLVNVYLTIGVFALTLTAGRLLAFRTPPPRSILVTEVPTKKKPIQQSNPGQEGSVQVLPPVVPGNTKPTSAEALRRDGEATSRNLISPPSWTPEEMARVGRAVHELILIQHEVEEDARFRDRLTQATKPLMLVNEAKTKKITFTIIKSDEVFTFSHPGHYIYVSRGLFGFVRNEVELQFQIARELAHLEQNDLVNAAITQGDNSVPIADRLYRQLAIGYADDQVFAADAQAFRILLKLGHPTYKGLAWLSPSYDFNGELDPRGTRRKPMLGTLVGRQEIENHWHAHPPASARLERLRSLERK